MRQSAESRSTLATERDVGMSGDRPIRPTTGTAAGLPYMALPPTTVDAEPAGPARLIVAWPGLDPPQTERALATALPMTGVPLWRVYLGLPCAGEHRPLSEVFIERHGLETYVETVERAAELLPAAVDDIRADLALDLGPIGLAGFSTGASAAFLALSRGEVPVTAAALVAPIVSPARTVSALKRATGRAHEWSEQARRRAERLDFTGQDLGTLGPGVLLLVGGTDDRLVPPSQLSELRERLIEYAPAGSRTVELATVRMAHALAPEPGAEVRPPTTEAVSVDGVLTAWFREHLAEAGGAARDPRVRAGADLLTGSADQSLART